MISATFHAVMEMLGIFVLLTGGLLALIAVIAKLNGD